MKPALLALLAPALLAQTLDDAVRDLAAKIAAISREMPALWVAAAAPGADTAEVRRRLRAELARLGVKLTAAGELRVTISENWQERLLVAEVPRDEERAVLISEWAREQPAAAPPAVSISRTLLREQAEPILDLVIAPDGTQVVLEPARVAIYGPVNAALPVPGAVPARDPRGRLQLDGAAFHVWLPGVACQGTVASPPTIDCKPGRIGWPVAPGIQAVFQTGRNYFEGGKTPPFYSAAAAGGNRVVTGLDGRATIYDEAGQPAGATPALGSEVAGASCGLLATVPGEQPTDAVRVFEIREGGAAPVSGPLEFSGAVTALWPAGGNSVLAVVRDAITGWYAAYRLVVRCAP